MVILTREPIHIRLNTQNELDRGRSIYAKKELSSLDRWPSTCRERFQRIIVGGFQDRRTSIRKLAFRVTVGADSRGTSFAAAGGSFTCAAASRTIIGCKNMAAVRMSSVGKALICALPIRLIGAHGPQCSIKRRQHSSPRVATRRARPRLPELFGFYGLISGRGTALI